MSNRQYGRTAEEIEIEKSLKASTYLDAAFEAIHAGTAPKINVPNYNQGGSLGSGQSISNESEGFSMFDPMFGNGFSKLASSEDPPPPLMSQGSSHNTNTLRLSKNQMMAINKYPTLIEFLGQEGGERLATQLQGKVNEILAERIAFNSKQANAFALACEADGHNIKQYFAGEKWLCRVTASGPFRGDEAIYYSKDKNVARVLRKSGAPPKLEFADITDQFNLIFEPVEGEIPIGSDEEHVAEESVEYMISAEE
jgi:hypothetical protein